MNLWILTEERPKKEVIEIICQKYFADRKIAGFINYIKIIPILENNKFTFTYKVIGIDTPRIENVYIKIISSPSKSSFVDFLIFENIDAPTQKDTPIYAIEETKTDDTESRNAIYQRSTKIIYINEFYPNTPKIMLYTEQKIPSSDTEIFGTKLLKTLGADILGKEEMDAKKYNAFESIDELIELKNDMNPTTYGTTVRLTKNTNSIEITAKLEKSASLAHDPNIGMTTIMSACLRRLGWRKDIIITQHNLPNQQSVGKNNKFIQIANKLNIKLQGLEVPNVEQHISYWDYDTTGEKIGTIFLDIVVDEFSNGFTIYHNHAGSERGYFLAEDGEKLAVKKYTDRAKYKSGDKSKIIALPDLVLKDEEEQLIINIEGEMYQNAQNGIEQLKGFDAFEKSYISQYYPSYNITRTVVLYGSQDKQKPIGEISFILTTEGKTLISLNAPKLFHKSFCNILSYWN